MNTTIKSYVTKYVNRVSSTNFLFVAVCERKYFAKVSVAIDLCQRKFARESRPQMAMFNVVLLMEYISLSS